MGREIKRVPLDFDFPIGASFHDVYHDRMIAAGHDPDSDYWPSWRDAVPEGEGWQLWQTVTDGPISPVFATPEELIEFMCQPAPARRSGPWDKGWDRDVAEKFVRGPGWAPSLVIEDGRVIDGPDFVTRDRGGD